MSRKEIALNTLKTTCMSGKNEWCIVQSVKNLDTIVKAAKLVKFYIYHYAYISRHVFHLWSPLVQPKLHSVQNYVVETTHKQMLLTACHKPQP